MTETFLLFSSDVQYFKSKQSGNHALYSVGTNLSGSQICEVYKTRTTWVFIANTPNPQLSGQPGSGLPGPGQPGSGQPRPGLPGPGQPGSGQPGSGQPRPGLPGQGQPESGQPGSGQADSGLPHAPASSFVTPPVDNNNGRQVVVGSTNRMTGI